MIKTISFHSSATIIVPQCSEPRLLQVQASNLSFQLRNNNISSSSARFKRRQNYVVYCESITTGDDDDNLKRRSKLEVGSPVVFIEAPKFIKTDTAISCLKVNNDIVKPGDVGRIVSRKPKDVWAVRISIGTYLIDGKYFRPLELD